MDQVSDIIIIDEYDHGSDFDFGQSVPTDARKNALISAVSEVATRMQIPSVKLFVHDGHFLAYNPAIDMLLLPLEYLELLTPLELRAFITHELDHKLRGHEVMSLNIKAQDFLSREDFVGYKNILEQELRPLSQSMELSADARAASYYGAANMKSALIKVLSSDADMMSLFIRMQLYPGSDPDSVMLLSQQDVANRLELLAIGQVEIAEPELTNRLRFLQGVIDSGGTRHINALPDTPHLSKKIPGGGVVGVLMNGAIGAGVAVAVTALSGEASASTLTAAATHGAISGAVPFGDAAVQAAAGNNDEAAISVQAQVWALAGCAVGNYAGAMGGGLTGVLGGPAAPATVPAGAVVGGAAGCAAGGMVTGLVADEVLRSVARYGDGNLNVQPGMIGGLAEAAVTYAQDIGSQLSQVCIFDCDAENIAASNVTPLTQPDKARER